MYSLAVYYAKPNFSCGGVPSPRDASSSFSKGVLVLVARSLAGGMGFIQRGQRTAICFQASQALHDTDVCQE
jgi:hypothetical protein